MVSETENIKPLEWDITQHRALLYNRDTIEPGDIEGLTAEGIEKLLQEPEGIFELVPDQPMPTIEDLRVQEAVGTGRQVCPMCHGTKTVRRLCTGKHTGYKVLWPSPCYCTYYQRYYSRWANPKYVGRGERDCTKENLLNGSLRPRFGKLSEQFYQTILATVRQFPFYNYLLVGPGGTGKTTLMVALYDQALRKWAQRCYEHNLVDPAVWRVQALALAKEQQTHAVMMGSWKEGDPPVPPPTVSPENIITAVAEPNNFIAHVSIDEFDKYKMLSDFQNGRFHAIIDTCWAQVGQVVCNSNEDITGLLAKIGQQYAEPMIRRLVGEPRGIYLNFWKETLYVNNIQHVLDGKGVLVPVPDSILHSKFVVSKNESSPNPTHRRAPSPPSYSARPSRSVSSSKPAKQVQLGKTIKPTIDKE